MRKPLAATGFSFFLTLVALGFFGYNTALAAGITLAAASIIVIFIRPLRSSGIPFMVFAAAGACFLFCFSIIMSVRPALQLDKAILTVNAQVKEFRPTQNGYSYIIHTESLSNEDLKQNVSAVIYTKKRINCEIGDSVTADMQFEKISDQSKEKYYPDGIYLSAELTDGNIKVEKNGHHPYYYYTAKIRDYVKNFVDKYCGGDTAGIIKGIVLSEKNDISAEVYDDVKICGISHILAVSGLHAGIIGGIIIVLLSLLGFSRRRGAVLAALFVWAFVAIAGFPFSAVRAGIMFTVFSLALIIFRNADSLSSLALALLVITIVRPFAAMDIGLLSSASSCVGLIVFADPIRSKLENKFVTDRTKQKMRCRIIPVISVTLAAFIGLAPCSVLYYRSFSPVAVLANIFVLPLVLPVLLFIIIGAVLFLVPGVKLIAPGFLFLAGVAAKYIVIIVGLLAKIPFASISLYRGYLKICLSGAFILFAIIFLKNAFSSEKKLHHIRLGVLLSAALFLFGTVSFALLNRNVSEVYIISSPYENAVLVHDGGFNAVIALNGSGENYAVTSFARAFGIRKLDLLIVADDSRKNNPFKRQKNSVGCSELILPIGHTPAEICGGSPKTTELADSTVSPKENISFEINREQRYIMVNIGKTRILAAMNGCNLDKIGAVCYNAVIAAKNYDGTVMLPEKTYSSGISENAVYSTGEYGIICARTTGNADISLERKKNGSN